MFETFMEYFVEFVKYIIIIIIDAVEEFFDALVVPSTAFTRDAFFVSLGFLGWSILSEFIGVFNCVSWHEALTCSILMLIIVLVDSSARSSIKSNIKKIKDYSSNLRNNISHESDCEDYEDYELNQEEVLYDDGN